MNLEPGSLNNVIVNEYIEREKARERESERDRERTEDMYCGKVHIKLLRAIFVDCQFFQNLFECKFMHIFLINL